MLGAAPNSLLALLWRERIEGEGGAHGICPHPRPFDFTQGRPLRRRERKTDDAGSKIFVGSGLVLLFAALISGCSQIEGSSGIVYFPNRERSWGKVPAVTISARENDPRIPLVFEAVEFWNSTLAEIGTPFRLGTVDQTTETLPAQYLARLSDAVLNRQPIPEEPEALRKMKSDLIVALSDGDFVSFSTGFRQGGRVIVGIRSDRLFPLTLPNVARNVLVHELGHAIGLGHNNDPTTLMCGRPASCRPDEFRSSSNRYFPLTEVEKAYLLKIYPATWRPAR